MATLTIGRGGFTNRPTRPAPRGGTFQGAEKFGPKSAPAIGYNVDLS